MPDTLEKDYVMCVFEILDGEREYTTKYFYPKSKYDKWSTKELLEEFFCTDLNSSKQRAIGIVIELSV